MSKQIGIKEKDGVNVKGYLMKLSLDITDSPPSVKRATLIVPSGPGSPAA
jgi:hypothetical protein